MGDYRRWWTIGGGVLGVALLGVALYNYCRCYCGAPTRLTMSGGSVCPLRAELADRLAQRAGDTVDVEVCRGTNSQEVCAAVNDGRLDFGLVLGGLATAEYQNVQQVGTLGVEPLHLLVRRELVDAQGASLETLRGRRVVLGESGSNGAKLAEDLLSLAGLWSVDNATANAVDVIHATEAELSEQFASPHEATSEEGQTSNQERPDAVFIVDAMPSDLVDRLVRNGDYALVPLPFATALHLDSRRAHAREAHELQNDRVEAISIPAFAYGIQPAMPERECQTIGLRLLLVANKNVPADAVREALRSWNDELPGNRGISLDATNRHPEFPVHPGAEAFLRARRPIDVAEILGPTTDALSVFGASIAGSLALWGFVRGLRAVHPDLHLRQVNRIERLLHGNELDEEAPTLPVDFLDYLETRLAQVKQAAIEDYTAGRLEGDEALLGILALVADTRHLLAQRRKKLHAAESSQGRGMQRSSAA